MSRSRTGNKGGNLMGKEYPNPKETENALKYWHEWQEILAQAQDNIEAAIPGELLEARKIAETELATRRELCREAAETHGAYKGEAGECRIEERWKTEYSVHRFKEFYPEFAFCIDEVVNKVKVEALVKGKLIDQEVLDQAAKRTKITEAFILR